MKINKLNAILKVGQDISQTQSRSKSGKVGCSHIRKYGMVCGVD